MIDSLRRRIQEHIHVIGFTFTIPSHLCPYALFLYIYGFTDCNDLLSYIKEQGKKSNRMISSRVQDARA